MDHLISARQSDLVIVNKKKKRKKKNRTCQIVEFSVLVDHRVKQKKAKGEISTLDLVRELKIKLWNMKWVVVPIVVGPREIIPKELVKGQIDLEIREQVEIIQTTA